MKIGLFRGKEIAEMSREELLEFAKFVANRIQYLEKIEMETEDYRLKKEADIIFNKK